MTVPWEKAVGMNITPAERRWLKDAANAVSRHFTPVVVVNIGVARCASMYCLRAGAPHARLVGIDIAKCSVRIHPELKAEFIIEDSRICHTKFKGSIHLLFIDGDHTYPVVKADIVNWTPKVVKGGVVVFHDYGILPKDLRCHPETEGVRRAVSEWAIASGWKRISAPDSLAAFERP